MAESGGSAEIPQPAAGDTRKRLAQWIEDGQALLGILPGLLNDHEQLKAKAQAAEREAEKLRQEIIGLRSENQALRTERTEIIETLGKFLNPQLLNEMMQKLRGGPGRKSPFEPPPREREKPAEKPGEKASA